MLKDPTEKLPILRFFWFYSVSLYQKLMKGPAVRFRVLW